VGTPFARDGIKEVFCKGLRRSVAIARHKVAWQKSKIILDTGMDSEEELRTDYELLNKLPATRESSAIRCSRALHASASSARH